MEKSTPENEMKEEDQEKESPLLRLMIWLQMRQNQTAFKAMEWLICKIYRRKIQAKIDALDQSIAEDKKQCGIPNTIEEYREKFKRVPLGRWNSSIDYGPFPTDAWEFHANGTGKIIQYSGSGDNTMLFEWQAEAERTIKFRVMDWGEPPENENDEEPINSGDEDEPMGWVTITYDFKIIEYYSPIVVMFQIPEGDMCKFWLTTDYLQFEGDIKV